MKNTTKTTPNKLGPETCQLIRANHGLAAQIAAFGGFNKSFATRVLKGEKRPSLRFLKALDRALADMRAVVAIQLVHHEHPEIAEHARR